MKLKKKNIVIFISIILIIIISLVLCIKIVSINKEYPPVNVIEKNINENIQLKNISFSIGKSEFKDKKDLINNYREDLKNLYMYPDPNGGEKPIYDVDKFLKENKDKYIVVPIHIESTGNDIESSLKELTSFIEQSFISINNYSTQSVDFINSNFKEDFEQNGSVDFSFVFVMFKKTFSNYDFENLENQELYFIYGVYPEQIKIRLQ